MEPEPKMDPKTPDNTPAKPPEPGLLLGGGGGVAGGELGAVPPPVGPVDEGAPGEDGGAVVPFPEPDVSDPEPVDEVPTEGAVLDDPVMLL